MGLELMDVVYPSMRWRHRTARNDQLMDFFTVDRPVERDGRSGFEPICGPAGCWLRLIFGGGGPLANYSVWQ
jgi:hypothetical protein